MRPGIRGTRSGVPLFVCCSRCFRWSRCFRRSQSPPRRLCPEWMLINIETICFSLICCFAGYFLYDSAMLMDTYIQHKCLYACSATPLPLQDLTPPIKKLRTPKTPRPPKTPKPPDKKSHTRSCATNARPHVPRPSRNVAGGGASPRGRLR